jgi:hypothetical protein
MEILSPLEAFFFHYKLIVLIFKLEQLIVILEQRATQLFLDSSYTMFNIIDLFGIVSNDFVYHIDHENDQILEKKIVII